MALSLLLRHFLKRNSRHSGIIVQTLWVIIAVATCRQARRPVAFLGYLRRSRNSLHNHIHLWEASRQEDGRRGDARRSRPPVSYHVKLLLTQDHLNFKLKTFTASCLQLHIPNLFSTRPLSNNDTSTEIITISSEASKERNSEDSGESKDNNNGDNEESKYSYLFQRLQVDFFKLFSSVGNSPVLFTVQCFHYFEEPGDIITLGDFWDVIGRAFSLVMLILQILWM